MPANAVLVNFSGGETSPRSRGRFDAPWYQTSAKKLLNYIAELTGSARYRPGFQFCRQTRGGAVPRMLPFQVNNNLAYMLEFTSGYMRVYLASTADLLTTTVATITGVTKAAQGVVTVSSAVGLANGQEIIVNGIVGMAELNNRQVLISDLAGSTFKMKDPITAAYIDTTGLTTYISGGTASVVYEITTPYGVNDLSNLQIASTRSLAYITTPTQPAQKLTVDANNAFTIGSYTRTNDPFTSTASLTVQGITSGALYDDFASGLGLWTPTLMQTVSILGSNRAVSSDTPRAVSGYTSSSMLAPQATGGAGQWEFDLINSATNSETVADTAGATFPANTPAFARFYPIYQNANNFYELRVYGTDCNSFRLYFNNAGVGALVATFTGAGFTNSTSRIKLTRTAGGLWTLWQNGIILGTVVENTLGVSVSSYFFVSAPWANLATGFATRYIGIDNVFFPNATAKTLVSFPPGIVPSASVQYTFSGVVGAVTINGGTYLLVAVDGSNVAYLKTVGGADVNSGAWGAYVSGGIAASAPENPIGVAFYEGRLVFAGTNQRPDCLFLSRSPDNNGNSRYDDFTGGTNADFACFFQLAPTGGSTDYISWARGGPDYLFVGTFGGPYRVSGSGLDIPITPSSINVRQFDDAGAAGTMAAGLAQMFFVQRSGVSVRAVKVINPYLATFESADLCQNAEQIAYSALQRVVLQRGRPDSIWTYRADGVFCNMSVHITTAATETVTGWARHTLGGTTAKVLDIAVTQRATGLDQLWVASSRTINGVTRCFVEVMADDVYFPDVEDFFSGEANKAADQAKFENVLYRLSEKYVHMDAAATYDGSARGVTAVAALTPGVGYGTQDLAGVVFTTNADVFRAQDVGSEIWKKPNATTGVGSGRALITGYTNARTVTVTIKAPFDSGAAVAAGDWHIAVTQINGLYHLEGQSVAVVNDGSVYTDAGLTSDPEYPTVTVANGTINLTVAAAVVHVGLPYIGFLESHNLEIGGRTGPAESKPRTIAELYIRFMNTLGCEYGTDLYNLTPVEDRKSSATYDRVAPVFSGVKRCPYEDTSSGADDNDQQKTVIVMQRKPLPSVVEFVDIRYDTMDEG